MRTLLAVLLLVPSACGGGSLDKTSPEINKEAPASELAKTPSPFKPSMQITGLAGEVRVQIATSCNCAKKPTLDVVTTDTLITIQGVLPDGPLARCAEPCVLYTQATGLAPGDYRVVYIPDGAKEPTFSGTVKVH